MLLFKRRIGETIMIGDFIQCTVLGLKEDQIRLGFSCVIDDIPIQTEEDFLQINEDDQ
ncbi:carbon storage regulator [Legionella dresdenensis]|uniref:Carbon storage regulator n=1 Tax=Legionella dresdenensis TaxID=450200 RepID=A0ABV8CF20_9GAMM